MRDMFLWPKLPIYLETCLYECLLAHYTAESVKDSQTKFQMFLQVSGRHVGVRIPTWRLHNKLYEFE